MNNIKSVFSIKDLENLSGIKAHTIRIWEKRYGVLSPMRTDTNIRLYDLTSLQKLLNITLLHNHGYKISKIATFPEDKIPSLVREIISEKSVKNHAISAFKMALLNFDQRLFSTTYNSLLAEKSFREVFYEVFLPLLHEMGLLWQSDTINPAQEHFMSYLIKQKLLINIEKAQTIEPTKTERIFVLYLPMNEIHQLGLMFINYEILLSGYRTIYLGESVPMENLKDLKEYFKNITFISYFTVKPHREEVNDYLRSLREEILDENSEIWVTGKHSIYIDESMLGTQIRRFHSIPELVDEL